MDEQDLTSLEITVVGADDARDAGAWTPAEIYRTQGFLRAGPGNIDVNGKLGQWRNLATDLVARRNADGTVTGEWKISIELHVHKWRFERSDAIWLQIKRGNTVLTSAPLTGFASRCTGWAPFTWSGPLAGEMIFAENLIQLDSRGDQTIVRC
jgi:hypothetical protein